ncbi:EF-hand domain-containing protein [Humisphaera borealis]|uniref:EF-hand domain-containing protein n=1 Tax=Humisphaera borealis TaxID=2807512 RepID=A0A7M2X1F0_9BACT|nr:EF-hand domain-containing protein [Humisphaera borealis]QOV91439.1 EF-hand domain-containing protein [Humisphaera borealis]
MPNNSLVHLLSAAVAFVLIAQTHAVSAPTYHRDIAPIILDNCAACHRPGEAAPFPLLQYADVKRRATQVADLTASRAMPPWKASPGEVHFVGERRLTDGQIKLISDWVAAGCVEGDPKDSPPQPVFADGWRNGPPDLVLTMPEPYAVPADGPDIYRSFVIPVEIPKGKFVRAAEFRPGNRTVVHHAVLSTMKREAIAKKLAAEPKGHGPGFKSGLNAPGDRMPGSPGIWVPGKDPLPLPDGYAMAWPQGCDLLVQLHLHPSGKAEVEQSSIGLYLTDEPPKGALIPFVMMNRNVDIAPGQKDFTLRSEKAVTQDVDVIGFFPHMHLIGRTCTATATLPGGKKINLLTIADWDFRWQGYYQCKTPVRLPAGTMVECVWTFDNSAENPSQPSNPPKRVRFGEGTTDEMGAIVMDFVPAPVQPAEAGVSLARDLMARHDTNKDQKLSRAELMKADPSKEKDIEHALAHFDADKDGLLNEAELKAACTALVASRER